MQEYFFAIDPSFTGCGLLMFTSTEIIKFEQIATKPNVRLEERIEIKIDAIDRFFGGYLIPGEIVAIEKPINRRSLGAFWMQARLYQAVVTYLRSKKMTIVEVNPTSVKKKLLKGSSTKIDMVDYVEQNSPYLKNIIAQLNDKEKQTLIDCLAIGIYPYDRKDFQLI